MAWIAGVVAQEEISIFRGVLIVILAGLLSVAANIGLSYLIGGVPVLPYALGLAVKLGAFSLLVQRLARIPWKQAFIVAAVYSLITFVFEVLFAPAVYSGSSPAA